MKFVKCDILPGILNNEPLFLILYLNFLRVASLPMPKSSKIIFLSSRAQIVFNIHCTFSEINTGIDLASAYGGFNR